MRREPRKMCVCVDCGGLRFTRTRTPGSKSRCFDCKSERHVFLDLKALAKAQYESEQTVFDYTEEEDA